MLNLKAETKNEEIILNYLNENASETLAEKINNGKKTLKQCWSYIVSEAKKLAENQCACVDDATVYGWAVHFFEEDAIEAKEYPAPAARAVRTKSDSLVKKEIPTTKKKAVEDQVSIFEI